MVLDLWLIYYALNYDNYSLVNITRIADIELIARFAFYNVNRIHFLWNDKLWSGWPRVRFHYTTTRLSKTVSCVKL